MQFAFIVTYSIFQYIFILIISIIISGAKNGQNGEEICQVQGSEKECLAIGCCYWDDTGCSLSDQYTYFVTNLNQNTTTYLSDLPRFTYINYSEIRNNLTKSIVIFLAYLVTKYVDLTKNDLYESHG
jgi:hypothetical protein